MAREGRRKTHTGFWWGKSERKMILGRPRRRWENNTKMDLKEIGREIVKWIDLAKDWGDKLAVVNTVTNFQVSENAEIS